MFSRKTIQTQPLGLDAPSPLDADVINRTGGERNPGDVVEFDLANANSDVDNNTPGGQKSGLSNVVTPTAAGIKNGVHAIVMEKAANGATMRVRIVGKVKVTSTGNPSAGAPLRVNTNHTLDASGATDAKVVGYAVADFAGNEGSAFFCGDTSMGVLNP